MFHMSREIYDKIEELARLIADSEEFRAMKRTAKISAEDAQAAPLLAEYREKQQALEAELEKDERDFDRVGALTRELDELGEALNTLPAYHAAQLARQEYDALLQGVADVLQSVIDPDIQCSCRGDCSECPGCGQAE